MEATERKIRTASSMFFPRWKLSIYKVLKILQFGDLYVDFTCEKVFYKSVVANVERRWHQAFTIDRKIFVHGGWNDGGPLDDLIYFDIGLLFSSVACCRSFLIP